MNARFSRPVRDLAAFGWLNPMLQTWGYWAVVPCGTGERRLRRDCRLVACGCQHRFTVRSSLAFITFAGRGRRVGHAAYSKRGRESLIPLRDGDMELLRMRTFALRGQIWGY